MTGAVDILPTEKSGDVCEDLLSVLGAEFSPFESGGWEAVTFGGTRYGVSEIETGFRLTWVVNPQHRMYAAERSSFGDHRNLAELLCANLEKLGWRTAAAEPKSQPTP